MGYQLVPRRGAEMLDAAHIPVWGAAAFRRVFARIAELSGEGPPFERAWRDYDSDAYPPRVSAAECATATPPAE